MMDDFESWLTSLVRTDPRSVARWENARARGKRRYVLVHGVLLWGMPMLLVMTAGIYVQRYGWVWPNGSTEQVSLMLFNLMIWPVGGYLFGAVMWKALERCHRAGDS